MSEQETVTTSTYITAEGKKVRKVKKKKVTIDEGGANGSRRESEVEITELSTTMNEPETTSTSTSSTTRKEVNQMVL
jgi:hypothetical protein